MNNVQQANNQLNHIHNHYDEIFKSIGCLVGCWYGLNAPYSDSCCVPLLFGSIGSIAAHCFHESSKPQLIINEPLSDRNIFNINDSSNTNIKTTHASLRKKNL